MKIDYIKAKSFIAPDGRNRVYAEECFRTIVSDMLDKFSISEQRPLLPESLRYAFDKKLIPDEPKSLGQIREIISNLIDNSMNAYHPKYIGHMDSMPTLFSVIGDMVASALNNNLFSLEMAPFLTQLEYQLVKEFCELFGLPENAGGMILSGGSLTNLQALIIARNFTLGDNKGHLSGSDSELIIFCSEHAHVSIQKAAMIMGIGIQNVIKVSTDPFGRMITSELRSRIKQEIGKGLKPCAIVATAGTTVTGNIDPIYEIAEIAKEYKIWLHVDAIWGGGLIFSCNKKYLLHGIEYADSITFNPQKWMAVAKTCSLLMFKNKDHLEEYFRIRKTYVKEHDIVTDLSETGITGTKRADILKLWLSLENMGMNGYQAYVDYTLELTRHFTDAVKQRKYLRLVTEPQTAIICMRGEPDYLDKTQFDKWNEELQDFLLRKKHTFFSLPKHNRENWQRIIILNPFLTKEGINEIFQSIDEFELTFKQKYRNGKV